MQSSTNRVARIADVAHTLIKTDVRRLHYTIQDVTDAVKKAGKIPGVTMAEQYDASVVLAKRLGVKL